MCDTKSVSEGEGQEVDCHCVCHCDGDQVQVTVGEAAAACCPGDSDSAGGAHHKRGRHEPVTFNIKVTLPHGMGGCCGSRPSRTGRE